MKKMNEKQYSKMIRVTQYILDERRFFVAELKQDETHNTISEPCNVNRFF